MEKRKTEVKRNALYTDKEIFYIKSELAVDINRYYQKNTSQEAIIIANHFFSLENLLLESFQYVSPVDQNGKTSSVRFATIIRESCNLFESISRKIFTQCYEVQPKTKLSIFQFLILDEILDLSSIVLRAPFLDSYHSDGRKIEPFISLKAWDRKSDISQEHVPDWWKSYNRIKHDVDGISKHANLHNAIYSLAAVFILIRKIYGDGLISGFLRKRDSNSSQTEVYPIRTSRLFIGEIMKLESRNK